MIAHLAHTSQVTARDLVAILDSENCISEFEVAEVFTHVGLKRVKVGYAEAIEKINETSYLV
jgi:predicted membrane GTPase involved in stress response